MITAEQIGRRVRRLSREIDEDYSQGTLHVVGVRENSCTFVADFVRLLHCPVVCSFLSVATEDCSWHGFPLRHITCTPRPAVENKDVLLVDGILQTGVTLEFLLSSVQSRGPKSARTAVLIEKSNYKRAGNVPDYVGFKTREDFLVGYGIACEGTYRELPYIGALERPAPR
ncbi:MAG: phosphoribosyltransferase [Terriglobia bacterium]